MARKKLYSDSPSPSRIKRPVKHKIFSPLIKARQSSTGDKYRDTELSKGRNEAQLYLDIAGVIFVVLNANQKVTLINKKGCTVLGYPEKDIIGKNWFNTFIPAGIRATVRNAFVSLMSGEIEPVEYFENPVLTKKGDERIIAWHNTVIKDEAGKITGTISSGEDITERKVAEEMLINALEESQQRQSEISAVLEGAHSVLKYHDFKSAAQAIFNSCKNLIGAASGYIALLNQDGTENEVIFLDPGGLPFSVDPRLPIPIRGMRGNAYHQKKAIYHNDFTKSEWMKFMPKGYTKLSNVLFAPMIVEGKVAGLLGLANKAGGFNENDIHMATAFAELASIALIHKKAEETIRRSEEYFRLVTENALDIITIIDAAGTILYKSLSVEHILGYKREDLIGRSIFTFVHPDDLPYVKNTFNHLIHNPDYILFIQFRHLLKDGSWRILEVIGRNVLHNPAVAGIVINSRDITERVLAEDELKRSNTDLQQFA
jgi:PAS domain S-box-containing protein